MFKSTCKICLLIFPLFFISCEEKQAKMLISFDEAFPKANKNLEHILGRNVALKSGQDTFQLKIASNKNSNLITDINSGDTVFYGKVSKYRGLYYFNEAINDSCYSIYAVRITDNLIYGLNTFYEQSLEVFNQVLTGRYPELVKYIAPDSSSINLHAGKKELRTLFTNALNKTIPDTIINNKKEKPQIASNLPVQAFDPEEFEMVSKVYPNPAHNYVNIEFDEYRNVKYQLVDINSRVVNKGEAAGSLSRINLDHISNGIYALTLTNSNRHQETIRIIKN